MRLLVTILMATTIPTQIVNGFKSSIKPWYSRSFCRIYQTTSNSLAKSSIGERASIFSNRQYQRQQSQSPILLQAKKKSSTTASTIAAANKPDTFWKARTAEEGYWRPTINDVERISWGKPAKKKGTGSRGTPHRLNDEERFLFEQGRKKGFLEVTGSGWRTQRRDAPLLNTYRSLCDARGQVVIVLHKQKTGIDVLSIDLSTLRNPETFQDIANSCLQLHQGGTYYNGIAEEDDDVNEDDEENDFAEEIESSCWETKPIYLLPSSCIMWELPRAEAKALGKEMAGVFYTAEKGKGGKSKKPIGVKPGKSRRHGGYGIG